MKSKTGRFFASTLLFLAPSVSHAQDYISMTQYVGLFHSSDPLHHGKLEVVVFREVDCAKAKQDPDPNIETIRVNDATGNPNLIIKRNKLTTDGAYETFEKPNHPVKHPFEKSDLILVTERNGFLPLPDIRKDLAGVLAKDFGTTLPEEVRAVTSAALTTVLPGQIRESEEPAPQEIGAKKTGNPLDDDPSGEEELAKESQLSPDVEAARPIRKKSIFNPPRITYFLIPKSNALTSAFTK